MPVPVEIDRSEQRLWTGSLDVDPQRSVQPVVAV